MPRAKPEDFLDKKQIFLLLFIRELVNNSSGLFQLKKILEEKNQITEELPKVEIKQRAVDNGALFVVEFYYVVHCVEHCSDALSVFGAEEFEKVYVGIDSKP